MMSYMEDSAKYNTEVNKVIKMVHDLIFIEKLMH